ncbi:Formimidoylglutamase [Diplonema papillatum]|nr:Formimidoylglutamase [Diplonema papillatum]
MRATHRLFCMAGGNWLTAADRAYAQRYVTEREGEVRIGQAVRLLAEGGADRWVEKLAGCKEQGAKYALLGVPEDVGPRANLGRGGSHGGWGAFLAAFLNFQSNRHAQGSDFLLLGHVSVDDIQRESEGAPTDVLRQLVERVDERVEFVAKAIISAGLEPIVIGGGHNNSLPLLSAAAAVSKRSVAAVNVDPHADFRPPEGRHSGNGFRYASARGALGSYQVLGLHENKNNEDSLAALAGLPDHGFVSFRDVWQARSLSLEKAVERVLGAVPPDMPLCVEFDVDAIANAPSSASTCVGIPVNDACYIITKLAARSEGAGVTYLHLAEAAPACHPAGVAQGNREVGQLLADLVMCYRDGRLRAASSS